MKLLFKIDVGVEGTENLTYLLCAKLRSNGLIVLSGVFMAFFKIEEARYELEQLFQRSEVRSNQGWLLLKSISLLSNRDTVSFTNKPILYLCSQLHNYIAIVLVITTHFFLNVVKEEFCCS